MLPLVVTLLLPAAVSEARQPQPGRQAVPVPSQRPQPPAGPGQPSQTVVLEQRDARETREKLNDLFRQYPPSVREVLRIDPTLMYRPDYVANYPMLAAFLEQHPEIAHNPGFFVGEYRYEEQNNNPRLEMVRAMRNAVDFGGVVLIVMTITAGIVFLVKTVVEHWRWQRALRAQNELNTKLIDRFASSEDLMAYLQSPQGKALTEGRVLQPAAPRAMSAPLSRIFWSLQSGIVLGALGGGLMVVSGSASGDSPELATFLNGVGIVILMIGLGFAVSAAVSYLLSQRLGLVQPLSGRYSGDASTS